MPASLPCPGCSCPVPVPAGHAKPTVRCGICWLELPVPGTGPALARPVPAGPVTASKPRFGTRNPADRDDDEDDRPHRRERKASVMPLLIVGGVAGMMLAGFAGMGYVGYLVIGSVRQTATDAAARKTGTGVAAPPRTVTVTVPRPVGVASFPPPVVQPPVFPPVFQPPAAKAWDADWKEVPGADGFTARVPPTTGMGTGPAFGLVNGERLTGKRYLVSDFTLGMAFGVVYFDVPDGVPVGVPEVLRTAYPGAEVTSGPAADTLGGQAAERYTVRPAAAPGTATLKAAKVGPRLFLALAGDGPGTQPATGTRDDRVKKFFDSVQLTFDPATPAPPRRTRPR